MEIDIEVFKVRKKRLEKFQFRIQASLVRLSITVVWFSQVNHHLSAISRGRCFSKNIKGNLKKWNQTLSLVLAMWRPCGYSIPEYQILCCIVFVAFVQMSLRVIFFSTLNKILLKRRIFRAVLISTILQFLLKHLQPS